MRAAHRGILTRSEMPQLLQSAPTWGILGHPMRVRDLAKGERDLRMVEITTLGAEMFGALVCLYVAQVTPSQPAHPMGQFVVGVFHPDDMPTGRAPRNQRERRNLEPCYRRSKEYGRGFSWHEAFRRAEIMKEAEDSIRKAAGFLGTYAGPPS